MISVFITHVPCQVYGDKYNLRASHDVERQVSPRNSRTSNSQSTTSSSNFLIFILFIPPSTVPHRTHVYKQNSTSQEERKGVDLRSQANDFSFSLPSPAANISTARYNVEESEPRSLCCQGYRHRITESACSDRGAFGPATFIARCGLWHSGDLGSL